MKDLVHFITPYVKDSSAFLCKIFTAKASIMHTNNKDTETCHVPLQNLLWTNETSITPTFPKVFFLMVLKHVMDSIIMFTFENTFELQLFRTAREYVLRSK